MSAQQRPTIEDVRWIHFSMMASLLCGTAFGTIGCHSKSTLTPQQVEGKRLYEVGCAHCHDRNDLGLKKVPPNLHGLFAKDKLPGGEPATDADVEQVLLHGKGMMPSFAYQMTDEQMAALLAYLHTDLQ